MSHKAREEKMKGIVIDEGEEYFTFLGKLFKALDNIQKDYNWLISDHVCYPEDANYAKRLSAEWCWMTGTELTEMIEHEDFQWIWGVLSGFPKHETKEEVLKYKLPNAMENDRIWQNPISMQHPLSLMEIIAWDSSMTVFISRSDDIIDRIVKSNFLTKDLEEYNL